ncbi:MAG: HEAT repeat domain-containing protein [Planctomycetia bacterium]|nr:HEAT repeat domain-containing protein [Planctomycetia bacterium]
MSVAALFSTHAPADAAEKPKLQLKHSDKIAIIGNTLADRMQHFGNFEALLYSRFPGHELVVRNLGFSGDELTLRLRSANFGSPDDHLRINQADVILAFFGYNESFGGEQGLGKFKQDLEEFIKHTLSEKYNGKTAPRLVLFSPIAHENLHDRNLPDGKENNARLKLYTAAMAEVARANKVPFVDLFSPSLELYRKTSPPLTINGVHLNAFGDRQLALVIDKSLFGEPSPSVRDFAQLEKIRQAVLDKNFTWFERHRTTDGYSIFGGRADLKFVNDQTNRVVMQREMEVLNAMTANRDRRIWAIAEGSELHVDDSNTPPFIEVITNKPGPLPGGKHVFLGGEEEIGKMTLAKGMTVNLVASEEMFPELVDPVQMAFDTKGRLWVAAWGSYPHWKPKDEMNDKLLILEDTNGDGKADKCITFADHLHNPTGFEFWGGGVLVAMAPDLLFIKDTDGDDKADVRERVISGLDSADTHHTSNSFTLDPGGALYFQEGTFHHSQVETPYGPPQRLANAGVFRYEPRSQKFEVYVSYGFANPHGHAFDYWGQDIVVDGTGANPYHAALFSGHVDFPDKHKTPPMVYKPRTRPCPGIEYLSSRHFPDEMQGNLLVGNVIGFQGILQYKVSDKGASFTATELEPIVSSSDPSFRPSDLEIGPDGALYFTDWHNPIIGHMQHNLRDPSRDRTHGRVYRVTYEGRPLSKPAKIAGEPIDKLLELLKDSEARVRYRAKIELSGRDSRESIAAVERWVKGLDPQNPQYEHHLLEALWVYQHHNEVNSALLERLLASPDFHARAAATRVLCYWRDRVSGAMELFKRLAADPHPRVRLEAVRAASFFTAPEAVEIPVIAAESPSDEYLDFVRGETLRTLDPYWKKALAADREVAFTTNAGKLYLLQHISNARLLKQDRTPAVCLEMLKRPGLLDENRREAVQTLARLDKKPELTVIIETINALDQKQNSADASVVFDLVRQLTSRNAAELAGARAELEKLAGSARQPILRQIGYVSLINVDKSADKAWKLANRSVASLHDFVDAMPLIADASVRASLYPRIEPLLAGLPNSLATPDKPKSAAGRYVRIELPRNGTLTLAEVEVTSGGRNVARQGKASQKNTSSGGEAGHAIDGNTKGDYGAGGQTHTEENTPNPWWEVDLGAEMPIDSIAVFNRTEGYLGNRLKGFTLKVLDKDRQEVFRRDGIEAPRGSATYQISQPDPAAAVRQAAMVALTYVRGREAKTFSSLAKFVGDDRNRTAAIRALQRIPRADWPKEQARPLLDSVVAYVGKISTQQRTTPEALDALEFAQALAALLPKEEARKVRADLDELGVRVVRVGTLFERMAYDKDIIAVRAGKPVEFIFENSDLMPHNFVISQPGSMEELGTTAEATAQQPGAAERHYVPQSTKILLSSTLLQPRASEKLSFVAPTQPGVYPYVCTYPGHWRRMYGALYVVEDLDAYLENPESYLAAHPLEIRDPLLKDRRPRTEWKFDDLAAAIGGLKGGRSYGNGKQIFQVANCVGCHKMDGVGNVFGPDLTKLDPKFQSLDILKELLEPSARINEKYQSYIFQLESGKVVTGLVLEETPERIKLIENPLAQAEPIELKTADVVERQKSASSLMPKGLLDKLSREEILDLIAYVAARGNQDDPLVQGGHEHGGHH